MDTGLELLLQQASLTIVEYAHHKRSTLNVRGRVLPYHVMTYLKSGDAQIYLNGEAYHCEPGTVAFIPAGVVHDHLCNQTEKEPAEFLWWHFTYMIAGTVDVFRLFNWPTTFRIRESKRFEEIYFAFLKHVDNRSSITDTIMATAKSLEIMAFLMENALTLEQSEVTRSRNSIPSPFLAILNEIAQSPEDGICLKALAEKYHMHPTYISNRFKYHFGITPTKFYHEMVVQKARKLLLASNSSVTEIAYQLGFSDLSAFSQMFTGIEGRSPTQFRRSG